MSARSLALCVAAALTLAVELSACQREARDLRLDPPVAAALDSAPLMPNGIGGAPPPVYDSLGKPYAGNAYQLSQGKRLYEQFNCRGCHGDGGGATGPALMDGWWSYGPEIESIFHSIRDGRPNGMPAFRERLTTEQLWQLAGYVQKIGAYTSKPEAPSRNDEMQSRPAESRAPAANPPLREPSRR
jgi:cytochrome c oxidase cbb3-type subunit 3